MPQSFCCAIIQTINKVGRVSPEFKTATDDLCCFMSLIATMLFKDTHTFGTFIQTWGMNFPCAVLWQMFYCGPLVRLIFRLIFREKKSSPSALQPKENFLYPGKISAKIALETKKPSAVSEIRS